MSERRQYPRVQADVLCRPAGSTLFHHKRNTTDISLGGMRVFADEPFKVGHRLEMEVVLTGHETVRCWADVVWVHELDGGARARFDVGLRFTDMAPADVERLASVLVPAR